MPKSPREVEPGEPPHPPFWDQKWPSPRFDRRKPDELVVNFMEWEEIDPNEFKHRRSRYQYVRAFGRFCCYDKNCLGKKGKRSFWRSRLTWVRIDMYKQTARIYGQKCIKCLGAKYGDRYCYPLPFYYDEWRDICLEALDKAIARMYLADDIVHADLDDGAFCFMTKEEQEELLEEIVNKTPHQRHICQRCKERKGPCWFPHKPEDCSRCEKDERGLCYDPKHYR